MKITSTLVCGLLLIFLTQNASVNAIDKRINTSLKKPGRPKTLIPIQNGNLLVYWDKIDGAISYSVRAYNLGRDMLHKLHDFVTDTHFNLTSLEVGEGYKVTVSAIYQDREGDFEESGSSEALYVSNTEVCKGGQQFEGCLAHCTPTCRDPNPMCDRRCVRGCQCPMSKPFWNGEECLPSYMCQVTTAHVNKPKNLQVFADDDTNNVVLTWDGIDGVSEFFVKVVQIFEDGSEKTNVEVVVQSNMALLTTLVRGGRYRFEVSVVTASGSEESFDGRSLKPPQKVFATSIYKNGFQAYWIADSMAIRYKVRLMADDKKTVLYQDSNVASPSVIFKDLSPSTRYFIQVASAPLHQEFGAFSSLVPVTTARQTDQSDKAGIDVSSSVELNFKEKETTPAPTTTTEVTTPTTTVQPKTEKEMTVCEMLVSFALSGNRVDDIPSCDSEGHFVTTKCVDNNCHCVDKTTGSKVPFSDFGAKKEDFPIDCDNFGESETKVLTLKSINSRPTSMSLLWTASPATAGFIVQMYHGGRLAFVDSLVDKKYTNVKELTASTTYKIMVHPVDFSGKVGSGQTLVAETKQAVALSNLFVEDKRIKRSEASLSWKADDEIKKFTVVINDCDNNRMNETEVGETKIVLKKLNPLLCYEIHVRSSPDTNTLVTRLSTSCSRDHPVDFIFALDQAKQNLPEKRFFHARRMVREMVRRQRGNGTARVAAMSFAKHGKTAFHFDKYTTPLQQFYGIGNITYQGSNYGDSRLKFAMDYIRIMYFSTTRIFQGYTVRREAIPVVVLFFGGNPANNRDFEVRAKMLRAKGAIIVGVGNSLNKHVMDKVSSDPRLSFSADNREEFNEARDEIMKLTCLS